MRDYYGVGLDDYFLAKLLAALGIVWIQHEIDSGEHTWSNGFARTDAMLKLSMEAGDAVAIEEERDV